MARNLKAIEPIRMSKRIAEAKSLIKPIIAVEARKNRNPNVAAGSHGITRKRKLFPEIADEPITKRKHKIKASENKRGKRPFANEATQKDIISYKTLYIETQKKVEDLTEENYKQAIDLSYRSGQVAAYEYVIGNMKNAVGFPNIMRVADAEMSLSKGTPPSAPSLNLNHRV